MPRLVPTRLAATCALALVLVLSFAASAAGGSAARIRVVGTGGKVLAERLVRRGGEVSIETSRKATCFGPGTGGSGRSVSVKGGTALGLLLRAARRSAALQPVLISDYFDFGLALCGVGGSTASSKASWYLKVNHENPELGGEVVKVEPGDEVLWALVGFPYPKELSLVAPFSAHAGEPFQVSVSSYDDKGRKRPAAGVTVTGASAPTDAAGHATVTLNEDATLIARRGKDIPSNSEQVFICLPDGACPVP